VGVHNAGPDFPPGTKVHIFKCMTELCPWNDENWLVQVNPDGTVPDPNILGRPKQYPNIPIDQKQLDQAMENDLKRQREAGSEIRF
jgi:hypothetical protein